MNDADGLDPQKTAMQIVASLAKDVYQDGLQPPVRVVGETLAGILRAITHYPRFWGQISEISLESKIERFRAILSKQIEAIPEENRVLPHPNIIGPSVQALEYGIFDNHLSDMFASLISTSMDNRISDLAHPSFVEIIKQISPDEARVVAYIGSSERSLYPICNVFRKTAKIGSFQSFLKRKHLLCIDAGCVDRGKDEEILDNLERLRVVNFDMNGVGLPSDEDPLDDLSDLLISYLEKSYSIRVFRDESGRISLPIVEGDYCTMFGDISITAFGMQFYKACVKQPLGNL